MKDVVQE